MTPHYYITTEPYRGACKICGFGPYINEHNTYAAQWYIRELELFEWFLERTL